jgi:hypothetical protein
MEYQGMTSEQLREAYRDKFGAEFVADWTEGGHEAEISACLEAGKPQDVEAFIASLPRWPAQAPPRAPESATDCRKSREIGE